MDKTVTVYDAVSAFYTAQNIHSNIQNIYILYTKTLSVSRTMQFCFTHWTSTKGKYSPIHWFSYWLQAWIVIHALTAVTVSLPLPTYTCDHIHKLFQSIKRGRKLTSCQLGKWKSGSRQKWIKNWINGDRRNRSFDKLIIKRCILRSEHAFR